MLGCAGKPRRYAHVLRRCFPPVLVLLAGLTGNGRAVAQEMDTWPTSQLQHAAQQAIERQQFGEAVPALAELDRRYRESSEPAIVQARELVLYFLGLGRLQAGDLPRAAETLTEFVNRYPTARMIPFGRLSLGDAWFYQGRFAEARVAYEELRNSPDALAVLDAAQRLALWDRLSDCCFAAQDWDAGTSVFRELQDLARRHFDPGQAREKVTKAGAYLLQAAIAREELDAALRALPVLTGQDGAARYDLSLNLALVRGGDALYERGRHAEALFFYEQVVLPPELRRHWETAVAHLEAERERIDGVWLLAGRRNETENALAVARQRLDQVVNAFSGDVADYTPALQFRIARCYLARDRTFEAYWAFHRLEASARSLSGDAYVEEALYGQVTTAARNEQSDRLRRAAQAYLERREFVRFLGEVAHELVQEERERGNTEAVVRVLRQLVERVRAQPEAAAARHVVYIVGSSLLALEELDLLEELFAPLTQDFPRHALAEGAYYWRGLSGIFAGNFAGALQHFEHLRAEYSEESASAAYYLLQEHRLKRHDGRPV